MKIVHLMGVYLEVGHTKQHLADVEELAEAFTIKDAMKHRGEWPKDAELAVEAGSFRWTQKTGWGRI